MSAIVLQQFAAAGVADGATHDDLKRLLGGFFRAAHLHLWVCVSRRM